MSASTDEARIPTKVMTNGWEKIPPVVVCLDAGVRLTVSLEAQPTVKANTEGLSPGSNAEPFDSPNKNHSKS